ncbi:hypothetical protein PIB30_055351 [Stylosanthes scabra]|uniref:ENT domain-containing protein n=1 Tax=Stylosanthes scabra TaxID=79078 RepID=A0ABU6XJY2_9FABA|nr:hypothetical protein [Stylosanthes scabra]
MYHHQDSHTDENVPPLNQNRVLRGSNGNIDTLIHQVEKEAYSHVLRAFKCQSDVLTWEKADLMVELRKELRVSDDEHTQLLTEVNNNSTIHQIREWRKNKPAQYVHDDSLHSTISLKNAQHRSAGGRLITNSSSYSSLPPLGQHGLYYDSGEANEMEEWVNLNKMPAEDIEWENEERGRPILREYWAHKNITMEIL